MHTGARARKQYIYIYLYISLYENLFENGCIYIYICYSPAGRSGGETVPEVLNTARGRWPRAVLRPRTQFLPIRTDLGRWITFLFCFFFFWDFKVSGKFSSTLQPMCVEVRCVRVDERRDRLQTKTKRYNTIFSSVIYIMALTALF